MSQTETKRHIKQMGSETNLSNLLSFQVYTLLEIPSGDGSFTRNGDKVYVTNITIKGILYNQQTEDSVLRMMIVAPKSNEAVSTSSNIFEDENDTKETVGDIRLGQGVLGPAYKKINSEAFNILLDKVYHLNNYDYRTRFIRENLKIMRRYTYDGTATAQPSTASGSLQAVFISCDPSQDVISSIGVELNAEAVVYFKDI